MPIRPENKALYPKDWKAISLRIRERSGGRCECIGECGLHGPTDKQIDAVANEDGLTISRIRRCEERNGEPAKWARGKIVLTVAHLDHDPTRCDDDNLKAMCQRCHLRYDREHHAETSRATRQRNSPQLRLLP
jgi:hypothetical protein